MSAYSKTPLAQKLGIKEGAKVLFINEPEDFVKSLASIPYYIVPLDGKSNLDYVHLFSKEKDELEKLFPKLSHRLNKNGMIWISWPKKASGVTTSLDENIIREIGLANGLVDVKVAAIDEIWSGLKFVYRIKDR
ncbi:MAG TPA: DUF3052 domain-containing protein [Patescibacteria group bacterium]|nr:DUF3052 domain-containing protein [Patescibacteria group bacterium]